MIMFHSEQRFIVTGASSGLGEGVALLLNELGASVIGVARNSERLEAMKAKAKYPENVFLEQKDLTENIEGLPAYVKVLKEKYGKFSGMAYCAGITDVTPLRGLDLNQIQKVFDIDFFAPIFMSKGIVDKRNNIGKGTAIVLISSSTGIIPVRGMVSYCGAKAALINSAKVISKEYSALGVRINVVSPSDIETSMTQTGDIKDFVETRKEIYPFGLGKPEDVANMIAFLLSDKAKWITGQNYVIDCGSF